MIPQKIIFFYGGKLFCRSKWNPLSNLVDISLTWLHDAFLAYSIEIAQIKATFCQISDDFSN